MHQVQAAPPVVNITSATYGPISTGTPGTFDGDNTAGHDSSATNAIIRSFDTMTVPVTIQFDTTNAPYTVKFNLAGSIKNGVVDNSVLNAEFAKSFNSSFDLSTNSSTFSQDQSISVTADNGGVFQTQVPINVFGAKDQTALTPSFTMTVKSLTQNGTTTQESISRPLTLASNATFSSVIVSSQTSLGVAIPNDPSSTPTLSDYAGKPVSGTTPNAILGDVDFAIGLKPIAGRTGTNPFLGAAYPDPGTPIYLSLTGSSSLALTNPFKIFQYGNIGQPPLTLDLNYLNPSKVLFSGSVPSSSGGESQQGTQISAVAAGTFPTLSATSNPMQITISNWSTGDVFPNQDSGSALSSPQNPWATQIKAFITGGARIIMPLDGYTPGTNATFTLANQSLTYTTMGTNTTKDNSDTNIIFSTPSNLLHEKTFNGSVNYTYNSQPILGEGLVWTNYFDNNGHFLNTDTFGDSANAALYMGQPFYGWTHYGTFPLSGSPQRSVDAIGGADILQIWNPEASTYDDTRSTYFVSGQTPTGGALTYSFQYGVSKSQKYSLTDLQAADASSFSWYDTPAEAEGAGQISAVICHVTSPIASAHQPEMNVPRRVSTTTAGTFNTNKDPYITISRATSYYDTDTPHQTAYTFIAPYDLYSYHPATYTNGTWNNASTDMVYGKQGDAEIYFTDSLTKIHFGSTALVEPYLARIDSFSSQDSSGKEASSFNSTDTATLSLKPNIESSNNTAPSTATVTYTLPAGVSYVNQTATYAGQSIRPDITTNPTNSQTTLTFNLKNLTSGVNSPIQFNVTFQQINLTFDSTGSDSVPIKAMISAPEDQSVPQLRTSTINLTVKRVSMIASVKAGYAGTSQTGSSLPIVERGTPFGFSLKLRNDLTAPSDVNVLDKLPQDGVNGSSFSGDYDLDSITAQNSGAQIWYTTNSKYALSQNDTTNPNTVYNNIMNGTDTVWQSYTSGTPLTGVKATAILFHETNVPPTGTDLYAMTYTPIPNTSSPKGNLSGDKYVNQAQINYASGSPQGILTPSNQASVDVVNRSITGTAWQDLNGDGLRRDPTSGEAASGLGGIHVRLFNSDNSPDTSKDLDGNDFNSTVTKSDGSYVLNYIPAGAYKVGFSINDLQKLGLMPTAYNAATSDPANASLVDPNIVGTASDGAYYLTGTTYTLPATSAMTVPTYTVSDVNAGFTNTLEFLALTHVPTLDFGTQAVPYSGSSFANKNPLDNYINITDKRKDIRTNATTIAQVPYYTPYYLQVALSQFKTEGGTVGLEGSNIQFNAPSEAAGSNVSVMNNGIVNAGSQSLILEHNNQHDPTVPNFNIKWDSIKLNIPKISTSSTNPNHMKAYSKYTANMLYSLTQGPQ